MNSGSRRPSARPGSRRRPARRPRRTRRRALAASAPSSPVARTTKIVSIEAEVGHDLVDLLLDRRGLALAPRAVDGDERLGVGELHALATECGEKPPKTTLCGAPMRAQASIATTTSGIIGRKIPTTSPRPMPRSFSALAKRWTSRCRSA
jgi:hypothetical protein